MIKKLYSAAFLALALMFAMPTQAQRTTPPPPGPAPTIELGEYESFTLKNGLKVYVVENHKQPVVSMSLVLDRDPILEGDKAGYVQAAGQMLRTGTTTRTKDQFDEQVDFIGADLGFSSTGFNASALKKHLPTLVDLTTDALLHPKFTQEELDKVKKQMKASLAQSKDNPDAIASRTRNMVLYGKEHPYGELMTEETVDNITLQDIQSYYNTYFKPNIGYLAVVGDVKPKEVKKLLKKSLAKWEKGTVPEKNYELPQRPKETQVVIVDRPSAVQSSLVLTNPADLKPGAEDAVAAQLMNNILGGGMDSRLFQNLRETHGYTYGAYSSINSDEILGRFNASANVRNAVTDSAVVEFINELSKIRSEKVTDEELRDAKAYVMGSFGRGLENPATVAVYAINTARYGLPEDYYANYLKKVEAVTAEDVQRVAQKYVQPDKMYVVAVGNASEIADKLQKFDKDDNSIAYYSTTGEKVDRKAMGVPAGVTAEQVIADYIKAIGGKANIEKLKDITVTSNATIQGMPLTVVQQQKGNDKFAVQVLMNNNPIQRVVINGDKGKMEAPMQGVNKEITKEELAAQKLETNLFAALLYDKLGIKTQLTGMEKVDGKDAYVVEVSLPNGQKATHYFAKDSGLRLKEVNNLQSPQGVITQTKSYSNYKEVNGVKLPYVTETTVGPQVIKAEVQNVEVNKGLADDTFKL
ncbi:putative Zn-dependent peptidase [Pontibacter ummariensis]|uniref:Predicted Zn-dependent peptidase n=1 Tax=Pontibacter ummariensis TaxID=1610492 RepID=A0A239CSF7_9BACT|nr:pitrilysin family protein [Pontibacter ummariensis]PRY14880.1 putative Zn-dependent peptidase [Pontibacter ummariensis]SNS22444.1 Predicted Zn-dependent peptidase [Pontibacter ummariensis]